MDKQLIKNRLEAILLSYNIDIWGYCSAEPFKGLETIYNDRKTKGTSCEFEDRLFIDALTDPIKHLDNAASFLVVLLPYSPYNQQVLPGRGRMASGTASEDYHTVLRNILNKVGEILTTEAVSYKIIVDTSPLSDRAIAVRAGLGVTRRNNMFYHQKYGSYVYIGSILMDIDLHEKDVAPMNNPCGNCKRCQTLCPSGAILGDGTIDSNKCISYLTQKKELSQDEMTTVGNQIYGCDTCQLVCPANRGITINDEATIASKSPSYESILTMSNAEFKETYKRTDSGWRGKRTLQRNALAAIANSGRQEDYHLLYDFRPESPILKTARERALKIIHDKED